MMLTKKKWLFIGTTFFVAIFLLVYGLSNRNLPSNEPLVTVKKGTIKEKIVAVGNIVPKHTISVKSNISGIVGELFHEEGDFVDQGAILLQVLPSPTPHSIAEAHANVKEHLAIVEQAESHQKRLEKLLKLALETPDNYAVAKKEVATSKARLEMAQQKLALIQHGEANIAGRKIKTMISSPISGYILQKKVNAGDPVVPLTDSQEGTVLLTIADMKDLIFKGTVNEIDVAKIATGMIADVSVAALPDTKIKGSLRKVDLQSAEVATTGSPFNVGFNIELNNLEMPKDIKLRAGYSATAEITVKEAKDTLVIPERLLIFKDNKIYVKLQKPKSKPELTEIKCGISDGINIQVTEGLTEGQVILDSATAES